VPVSPKPFSPIYPIVDVDVCRMRGVDARDTAAAFINGGATILQVRQKSGGTADFLDIVRHAVAVSGGRASVIVNDRADLAAIAGAAGVHVGQHDLPLEAVLAIAGAANVCGISTHTREQVDEAVAGPAAYIAVGPIFRTGTKVTGYDARGLDLVRYAAGRGKPVVAIGGITLDRAPEVISAGADSVAVISDLLSEGDPAARVARYLDALGGAGP
jgi:thiamine-phosphate pyrophosphorylase